MRHDAVIMRAVSRAPGGRRLAGDWQARHARRAFWRPRRVGGGWVRCATRVAQHRGWRRAACGWWLDGGQQMPQILSTLRNCRYIPHLRSSGCSSLSGLVWSFCAHLATHRLVLIAHIARWMILGPSLPHTWMCWIPLARCTLSSILVCISCVFEPRIYSTCTVHVHVDTVY